MPFKATESDLLDFLKLSPQTEVEIPVFQRKPHKKIGFAFVSVDLTSVEDVLKFNDEEMMGRKLKIALAKNQSKQDTWQKRAPAKTPVSAMYIKFFTHILSMVQLYCAMM